MAKESVKPVEGEMKFGVSDLASLLDTDSTYTRVKLRNAGIKKMAKGGTAYGWNTKDDLKAVAEQLKSAPAPKATAKKDDGKASAKKDDKKVDPKAKADVKGKGGSASKDAKADTKASAKADDKKAASAKSEIKGKADAKAGDGKASKDAGKGKDAKKSK